MPRNIVLCAGAVHLDIIAKAQSGMPVTDKAGTVSLEIGGSAGNIAVNLATAGTKVRLLSALNGSAYAKVISSQLQQFNIDTFIVTVERLPTAVHSLHLGIDNKIASAVTCSPIDQVEFDNLYVNTALSDVMAIVIDCNLGLETINQLIGIANTRAIPAYIVSVAEEKSVKLTGITGTVEAIFMSRKDHAYLSAKHLQCDEDIKGTSTLLQSTIVICDPANGVSWISRDFVPRYHQELKMADEAGIGMVDAVAASVVRGVESMLLPMEDAVISSMSMLEALSRSSHCNIGDGGKMESYLAILHDQAKYDVLTGVYSRYGVTDEFGAKNERRTIKNNCIVSIGILDIDMFKNVNDQFGHPVGDLVIAAIANIVKSELRGEDYIGRWGGEEFVIALHNVTDDSAFNTLDRIRQSIEEFVDLPHQLRITVSIGYTVSNDGLDLSLKELIEDADSALYVAKNSGRNRVVSSSALLNM